MARKLEVVIVGDASQLEATFGRAANATQGFGNQLSGIGRTLTRSLTPAAAALGFAAKKAFDDWDGAQDAVRAGTGATGQKLEELVGIAKKVGTQVNIPLTDLGQIVANLNTRLGVTGKPLERLTKQFGDLKALKIDVSVASITRLFGDWTVAAEKQADTMDFLFRMSQKSGIGIEELSELMVQFGSPLRQLGLDFETTAALFARFEKEGVNIQTALPGLRMALKNFAKAGREPGPALLETIKRIKEASSTAKANTIAFQVFGVRAGPDLAAAIREGRFELEDYIRAARDGPDTIERAADATEDLGDKLGMFKNRVVAAVGPYGEFLAAAGAGLAAIGPTLFAVGQLVTLFPKLAAVTKIAAAAQWLLNAAMTANPIGVVVVALAALVTGLIVAWQHSETFRRIVTAVFNAVKGAADAVLGFFRRNWPIIATLISGPFFPLVALATNAFGIRTALVNAFTAVKAWVSKNWPEIATVISGPFAPLVALATDAFGVRSALVGAFVAIRQKVTDVMGGVMDRLKEFATRGVAFIKGAAKALDAPLTAIANLFYAIMTAVLAVKGAIVGLIDKIGEMVDAAKKIGGALGSLVGKLPGLQHGGIAEKGRAYIVGERGPELFVPGTTGTVIPHFDTPAQASMGGASPRGGGTIIEINVGGSVISERDLIAVVREGLIQEGRRIGGNLMGGYA